MGDEDFVFVGAVGKTCSSLLSDGVGGAMVESELQSRQKRKGTRALTGDTHPSHFLQWPREA